MNANLQKKMARWSGLLASLAGAVGSARLVVAVALALLGAVAQPAAAEEVDYTKFNHMTTGFPLDGQHLNLRCEQCHLNGVFEGTPRQCNQCHVQGNQRSAVFMPINHIPTPLPCDSCHTTNTFQGTHFAHSNVMPGTCAQCHNNVNALGKNVGHIVTTLSCDFCHTTVSFAGAFASYPQGHIPTSMACATCHSGGYDVGSTQMVHAGISTGCTACHAADAPLIAPLKYSIATAGSSGATSVTYFYPTSEMYPGGSTSMPHITTSSSCETCHTTPTAAIVPATASISGFAGGQMNHAGISGGCAACHDAGKGPYRGVPGTNVPALVTLATKGPHIPISGTACENCHKSTTVPGGFAGTAMVHTGLNGLATCSNCHETNSTDLGYFGLTTKLVLRPPTSGTPPNAVTPVDANHPTSGECSQCHSSTTSFNANIAQPSNHIPIGTTACANCHTGSTAPYAPVGTVMNHAGFTTTCSGCHGAGKSFYGTAQTEAGGQPMQPPGTIGTVGAANHIPYGSADCVGCHSASSNSAGGFKITGTPALSASGHAAVNALTCQSCHYAAGTAGNVAWFGTTAVGAPGAVGTSGTANHIAFGSGDCKTCHGSNFATGGFKITTTPLLAAAGHAAVSSLSCASCHAPASAWFGAPSLVTQLSNHIPIASAACSACHASNFVVGGFKISSSPTLSVAGHAAVSSVTCNSCHENNATDLGFQGVLTQIFLRPGTTVAGLSPVDAAHATGNLAAPNDCVNCHNTTPPFSASQLPSNHFPLPTTATPACATCHSAGYSPTLSKMVHSAVTGESCTTCHGAGKGPFSGTGPGTGGRPVQPPGTLGTSGAGNHIPVSSADCVGCHASTDTESGTGFKLTGTPVLSLTGHTAVNALTCQTCHASGMAWFGVTTLVVPPGTVGTSGSANHIALGTGDCKTCHTTNIAVGGFKIATAPSLAAAGHAAVSSVSCASCHGTGSAWFGVTSLVTQLSNHFPIASAACSACHASNFITGGFKISTSPTLSVAGHAAVSGLTCISCHENNATDLGFQGVLTQIYVRPGLLAVGLSPIDLAHAVGTLLSADCSQCHNTTPPFTGSQLPGNHFPLPATAAPACATCHAAGYGVGKSIMVHSSVTSETCTTCHGAGKGPFAGTSQGTGGQPKQPPGTVGTSGSGNHIPVGSADCGTTCHASADAMTGTGFHIATTPALSAAGHTAVVSSVTCQTCHNSGLAWFGVTIKTPPGTVGTSGAANHIPIPSADNCNTCHANTNYVSFAGTTMNHTGIASNCSQCHNGGMAWYGVTIKTNTLSPTHIPVAATPVCEGCHSPTTFTAFGPGTAMTPTTHLQVPTSLEACTTCHENGDATKFYGVTIVTRPTATADPSHPTTGDCGNSGCHTTTPPFSGGVKPSNHIASSATCSNCHTGYTPATTTMNHTDSGVGTAGSPVACATCHGYAAGPYYGTAQGQAGGQPLQPPGTLNGPASASQHVPFIGAPCSMCHTSTTVPGGFKGTKVPHTNGPFMTYTRGSGKSNSGSSTPKCVGCHAPKGAAWYGASLSTETMGSHESSNPSADCIDCHSATGGFAAAAAAAAKAKPRPTSGLSMRPAGSPTAPTSGLGARAADGTAASVAGGPFLHTGVTPGACTSCHRPGGAATALPGGHLPTTLSCDACHRTTTWTPAVYTHAGVGPGHCASCHAPAGKWATPKPAGHFLTVRSCDVCHHGTSTWLPVMYDHLSPRYRPQTGIVRCIDCHTTNTEMVVPGLSKPAGRKALPGGPIRNQ